VSLAGSLISALTPYDSNAACVLVPADKKAPAQASYTFTASAPGLYRLKLAAASGVRQVLIRVVERSVLDAIPDAEFRSGYGHGQAARLVLRSVVNHAPDAWDGTASWFWDGRIKLSDHGAVVAQV
jgi:hypothetical protein